MASEPAGSEEKTEPIGLGSIVKEDLVHPLVFLDLFPMFDWITSLQLLNKTFNASVAEKCKLATELDLSQLWSIIGDEFITEITALIKRFPVVTKVSFAYCHNIDDDTLKALLKELEQPPTSITSLNLFYNNRLSDDCIKWVCFQFPNLVDLNVGRCMSLTEKSIDKISDLQSLKTLSLSSTEITTEGMMLLDENGCLGRLKELNVTGCKKITRHDLDEFVQGHKDLKVISELSTDRKRVRSTDGRN